MKRLMLTLSSLTLLGSACGGRVNLSPNDNREETAGAGSGGGLVSAGSELLHAGSGGGSNLGGSNAGKAGTLSMLPSPDALAEGGSPSSTDSGTGGAIPSLGGAPGAEGACQLYCRAYTRACPLAGLGAEDQCTQKCVSSLELDGAACSAGKRAAFECIASAMDDRPDDCNAALAAATKQCGSASPRVAACNANCLPTSVFGGGSENGCHAQATCRGVALELFCEDTNSGDVPCTCSVDGNEVWTIATGFSNSKNGCVDEDLFRLCAKELP
jgi:hypothetical protein